MTILRPRSTDEPVEAGMSGIVTGGTRREAVSDHETVDITFRAVGAQRPGISLLEAADKVTVPVIRSRRTDS